MLVGVGAVGLGAVLLEQKEQDESVRRSKTNREFQAI